MKNILSRILLISPSLIFCSISYILNIENDHYGYLYPGINYDSSLLIIISTLLTIILSFIAYIIKHKDKVDTILPSMFMGLAVIRIWQIFRILLSYI